MDLGLHPPLPPNPSLPPQNGYGPPQTAGQQQKRKKRGKRGSGLGPNSRSFKHQPRAPQQLGFFGQVPNLQDLRQENRRRTQQHYGGPPARGGFQQQPGGPGQQHGRNRPLDAATGMQAAQLGLPPAPLFLLGRRPMPPPASRNPRTGTGRYRRSRPKQPKFPQSTPCPVHLTPAAGNPLDTPANVGKVAAAAVPAGVDKLEAEGLQAGLDWYGTNENSAALFLAGQQLTTSDSEGEDDLMDEGDEGSEGELHSGDGGAAAEAGGGDDHGLLPRHVQARLVEQEAYITELEDQNLRLREQLEMLQQEMEEARAQGGRAPVDSEEGFAEHSEGSLPGDLSVMQQHHLP